MQALAGVRVLELGSTVAGPFCGRLMADFGAEVVKVEPPAGDAVRSMGKHVDGKSLYAASILRNKRLVAINLANVEGREIIKEMVRSFDVLIENFRPGTMEKWGLGYDELRAINPSLIMVRISGFGQDGPYRERPGYGFLGDAVSGLLGITGFPDRPPVRAAVPVTDMLTAIYAAYGTALALLVRAKTGEGQCIDAALYESSFSLMESHVPAFEKLGTIPPRSGSRLPGSTPNNLYASRDGAAIAIAAASDSVFARLAAVMGQPSLATDPRFAVAIDRVKNEDALDEIIEAWTRSIMLDDLERRLHEAAVPASRVFTLGDIFANEHYRARNMLLSLPDEDLGGVTVVAPVPKLSRTPGVVHWAGRQIGEDTEAVLTECGFTAAQVREMESRGVVARRPAEAAGYPTRAQFVASTMAAVASIGLLRARAVAAPQFNYKFAHNVPADHPFHVTMVEMWNTISRETNGRIKMKIFPQNQLGNDPQTLTQLRSGALEFAALSGAITGSVTSVAQIENLPYAYKSDREFFAAMDGRLGEYVRKEMETKGLVALPKMFYKGFRQVTSGTHPIRTVDDFSGFTIRTPPTGIFVDFFRSLGARPVPIGLPELYTALQTHVADGEENSYSQIELNHYFEVQKYLSVTNHVTSGLWILANPDAWRPLPDDIRAAIVRNAARYVDGQRRLMVQVELAFGDKLRRRGLKFNTPDIATFMPRLTAFYSHWRTEFGATAWSLLESSIGKLG